MTLADRGVPVADPAWVVRYETLRSEVLEARGAGSRLGLALVLREGLAVWMAASVRCPAPVAAYPTGRSQSEARVSDALSADLVEVLTSMALSGVQEQPA